MVNFHMTRPLWISTISITKVLTTTGFPPARTALEIKQGRISRLAACLIVATTALLIALAAFVKIATAAGGCV